MLQIDDPRHIRPHLHDDYKNEKSLDEPAGFSHTKLFEIVRKYKPKKYMEIGSGAGFSASIVATSDPEIRLYLYDLPGAPYGGFKGAEKYVEFHMKKFATGRCTINFGDSQSKEMKDIILKNGPYDLMYIDGDHSYNGARSDWDTVKQCIKDKGIVLIDDTNHDSHKEELTRLYNEALEEAKAAYQSVRGELFLESTGVGIIYINID